jgi:hypothetical protein
MSFRAVGFGFLPAFISFQNRAVFSWAFKTNPDTIGVLGSGQSSPSGIDPGDPK